MSSDEYNGTVRFVCEDGDDSEYIDQESVEKLRTMHSMVNWEIEKERLDFIGNLNFLMKFWRGEFPNLRDIFRPGEIECLFVDIVNSNKDTTFIKFVSRTGYRDELEFDEDGKPVTRRATPLHHVVNKKMKEKARTYIVPFFQIYDTFHVNYTDELGTTHFHAACVAGCEDVVQRFLEHGEDPNCLWPKTGDTPLLIALEYQKKPVAKLLLINGADPNWANKEGITPLHMICYSDFEDDFARTFFEINQDRQQRVEVDARDNLRRTPLQWAVASLSPYVVDVLLDNGADLSNFKFPDESYFGDFISTSNFKLNLNFVRATGTLAVIEVLENKGYEFDRSDTLVIMKFFDKHGLFRSTSNIPNDLVDDLRFASCAKDSLVTKSLSLYDLIHLPPKETSKLIKYTDYFKCALSAKRWINDCDPACAFYLCELVSRSFFLLWALDPFWELMRCRLPIEICEIIISKLTNKDLCNICMTWLKYLK